METPLISVIVPVYNVEPYLAECLDSVIAQSYKHIEIILVDDGSTDQSGQLCDQYAGRDPRITVIHKKNGGLSEARNVGIDRARGEYLAFVDSDDAVAPDFLEVLYTRLTGNGADLAMCHYEMFTTSYGDTLKTGTATIFDRAEIFRVFYQFDVIFVITWNKLYKKELFNGLRFPVGKKHEDEFMVHHILNRCSRAVLTDLPLYKYRQRPGSITSRYTLQRYLDTKDAMADRIRFAKRHNLKKFKNETLRKLYDIQLRSLRSADGFREVVEKDILRNGWFFGRIMLKSKTLSVKEYVWLMGSVTRNLLLKYKGSVRK